MRRIVTVVICAAALGVAVPAAGAPAPNVAAMTRIASRLSGLHAKMHVRVVVLGRAGMRRIALKLLDRDYPPARQAYDEGLYRALGLLGPTESLRPFLARRAAGEPGVYDATAHVVYVRSGSARNRTIVYELVHALQDQSFDLRRFEALRRQDRDAALAAAAAVDGHAAFATQVLGGFVSAGTNTAPPTSGSPLGAFLDLENHFPQATGLRFVATLHNLGGNKAVFTALRRFPQTTKQIFHVDAFLAHQAPAPIVLPGSAAGYGLAGQDTFGELDVRALLAVFQIPRLDRVGTGWDGGRSGIYQDPVGRRVVAVRLDWEEDRDAAEWAEAVLIYVNEAFDADTPGFPPTTPCAADVCWDVNGHSIAFTQRGTRTALTFGPSVAVAADVANAVAG